MASPARAGPAAAGSRSSRRSAVRAQRTGRGRCPRSEIPPAMPPGGTASCRSGRATGGSRGRARRRRRPTRPPHVRPPSSHLALAPPPGARSRPPRRGCRPAAGLSCRGTRPTQRQQRQTPGSHPGASRARSAPARTGWRARAYMAKGWSSSAGTRGRSTGRERHRCPRRDVGAGRTGRRRGGGLPWHPAFPMAICPGGSRSAPRAGPGAGGKPARRPSPTMAGVGWQVAQSTTPATVDETRCRPASLIEV